jgi:hypothetical protein
VLAGLATRAAAATGLALNLVLFLTASWKTSPYFLGSDTAVVEMQTVEDRERLEALPEVRETLHDVRGAYNLVTRLYHQIETYGDGVPEGRR